LPLRTLSHSALLATVFEVGWDFADGEQSLPLIKLLIAADNLWVLWNTIQGHAVACIQHDLLLFEEILLTYLDLGEERDDLASHRLDGAHDLEPTFGALWSGAVEVIYEEHFVLTVEIQFLLQKSLRVLVHEVVGGVGPRVTIQMLSQLVRRLDRDERCCVLRQPL
jgi:hypothetical protein